MPERLKLMALFLKPNFLMIIEAKEGVGHTGLQLVIRLSMVSGPILCS